MATNLTLGTLFTADVSNFIRGVSQIRTALNSLHTSMTKIGSGSQAMSKGIASGLNTVTSAINKQNQAITQSKTQLTGLAGMWQRVQQAMKTSLAYGTAGAAIYTVIDGLKKGVVTIAEYDQALKNLQAITQATDAEMVGLADTIKEVSSKYVFSTKEISDGMVLMGQAGFSATQTMQAMDSAAKLAMGTLEDMELTVDLLTTTVVAFNMKSVESEKIADIMANAMNRSKLTLDKLRVSFNYVGNAAYEAGISLEETAAAMSVMSNAGMRASTIGTAFRQIIANLIAPNRRVREELQGLGIELSGLDPKVAGFSAVVQNLNKILVDQKTGLVDMTKAYNLFGLRAAQAAAILARTATEEYPRMLSMMYEVGSASAMADKQMEGLIARFKNLAANAQLIAVAIGEGGMTTVFRMLADALTNVTKAIKTFVESDIGQIAIRFVSMTAAASGFILTMKLLMGVVSGLALKAFGALIVSLQRVILLFNSLRMMNLAQAFTSFFAALSMGHPLLIGIAVAVGGIITAISYLNEAEERQIKSVTKSSNAYRTAADTFGAYRDKLISLKDQMAKGKDVTAEYNATITRLLRAYPQLTGIIDNNTESLDKNIEKLGEYEKASIEKDIEKQLELLKIYDKQLADISGTTENFAQNTRNSVASIAPEFMALNTETQQLEAEFAGISNAMTGTTKSADELVDSFGNVVSAENATGEEARKTAEIMKNKDAALVAMAKGWEKLGDSLDTIKQKLRDLRVEEGSINVVAAALKKWSDDVAKEASEIEAAMQNLPHVFTEFFETLDAGSKVAFAKAAKSMESEVAQYQKTAQAIMKTEEDRYAAEAFIRTKHLMKFADDVLKEKVTGEQLLKFKKDLIEEEKRLIQQRLDSNLKNYTRIYEDELKAAKGNAEKIAAAQLKYQKNVEESRRKSSQAIIAIAQAENIEVVEAYKKTADEVVKTGQKMADDYLKQLQRLVEQSEEKIKQLKKAQTSNEEDLTDKIRGLKQKGMSDTQKFADNEARINELLGKARDATYKKSFDEAKKYYDKAADVADNLATEIKDSQGNIIESEAQTTATAIRYLEQIKSETKKLYDQQIEEEKKKGEEAKTLMTDLNTLLTTYGQEWDKISQQKVGAFVSALNDVLERMKKIEGVTSNIRDDWETVTGKLKKQPKPQEPSLGAQPGLTPVQKKPEGEGTITVGGKTYDVNEFAGGGGTISVGGKTYSVHEYAGGNTISVGGKTYGLEDFANGVERGVTSGFDEWYAKNATKYNLNPDPYAKEHYYDYEGAYNAGVRGPDESGHWPSEFKLEGHPNMIVDGINTKTGEIVDKVEELGTNLTQVETTAQNIETSFNNTGTSITSTVAQMTQLSTAAEWVKTQFAEVSQALSELAQKPLSELITQGALDILTNTKDTLSDIKSDWDSLQSKTITLTINTKQGEGGGGEGGGSSGGGSTSYDNPDGGGYDETAYHRWGGLVRSVKDVATSVVTFARRGLRLPGYGGGDKVPVMAEAGEYVVNKESTRKFLPMIEAINNDTVPNTAKRYGGIIRSAVRTLAFQQGGSVPALAGAGGGNSLVIEKLEIKPTYMSGDRASARRLAIDLERELSELQKRKGR